MKNSKVFKTIFITDDPILLNGETLETINETDILDDEMTDLILAEDDEIILTAEVDESSEHGDYDLLGMTLNGEEVRFTPAVEKHFMESYTMYDWSEESTHSNDEYRDLYNFAF